MQQEHIQKLFDSAGLKISLEERQHLARDPREVFPVAYELYSTKLIERAMGEHRKSLEVAAEATSKYSGQLVLATWALLPRRSCWQ